MLPKNVENVGFVDAYIDPTIDLEQEIATLKRQKNAIILAHYYQDSEIQDVADFIGDSLGLAQKAAETTADLILFAGVHFMAETAKILNPNKKVILPDLNAGCSLSDSCPADAFKSYKERHPGYKVISYVNCSAGMKTLSDVIVTSSNAMAIVNSFPPEEKIIFAPDKNLGAYINKITGRNMVLWNGACMVHEIFNKKKILELKNTYPEAELIAHPECEEALLLEANYIGSTTGLLNYVKKSNTSMFIVATEPGIIYQMKKSCPNKTFIPAPSNQSCSCNNCPHMKLNTLEKLYNCLLYELPEIILPDETIQKALSPIQKMLEISKLAKI